MGSPFRDAGPNGEVFVTEGLNHHQHAFWEEGLVLRGHPQKQQLLLYLRDGVSVFDFLKDEFKGASRSAPYRPEAFPRGGVS